MTSSNVNTKPSTKFVIMYAQYDSAYHQAIRMPYMVYLPGGDTAEEAMEVASKHKLKEFEIFESKGKYKAKPVVPAMNYERV